MANTTNLNLVKPAGTDYALVSVINGNMDIIDSKVGAIPANESAQSQITALNNQIENPTDPLFGRTTTSVTDVNSAPTGWYYASSSVLNIPSAHAYFILTFLNSDHGAQIAIRRTSDGYMYFRRKNGGTWGSWYQVTANVVS